MATDDRTHTAFRDIQASPEAIYRAFLTREAMSSWLPPAGAKGAFDVFEPHVGGRFRLTLTFDAAQGKSSDHTDVVNGSFAEFVPERRIVMIVAFDSADAAFVGRMTMTWELQRTSTGTRVTTIAEHVPAGISQVDHETGMQSSLAHLAAFVERAG
ncbi:SRPBCC domain-containing protein [Dyella jiangningensis]|nr:SRPBCC domain-containing protein [Dyella jiangningensis]